LVEAEGSVNTNTRVRQYFDSLILVEKVTWVARGLCEGLLPVPKLRVSSKNNFSPIVNHRIENITARVGELLVYQIPEVSGYHVVFHQKKKMEN